MAREPIAVLLLPRPLEELDQREALTALLRGAGVVAIEPGRMPPVAGRRARGQARRLLRRLPGRPVAVVTFGEREEPLARELSERAAGCELIAAHDTVGLRTRFAVLGVEVAPEP